MKCISCDTEINPQWAHAINMNVCPFCGKHIMEEHLKNLFSSLRETMDQLLQYPEQLNDWLLSNHSYIKTDSPDIGQYMPKEMLQELKKVKDDEEFQKRKDGQRSVVKVKVDEFGYEEEVLVEKLQSEEKTNEFMKRAEIIKPVSRDQRSSQGGSQGGQAYQSPAEKNRYLKELNKEIRQNGSQGVTLNGASMSIPAEMLENADPEAVAEFESMMSGGEVTSSFGGGVSDGEDIPSVVFAMQNKFAGGKGGQNPADLMKLQQMQEKARASREAFENGENRGRAGGFSRSS